MPLPLLQQAKPVTIIAVASGKGGVGKSTVAVQLALALKELHFKVGLLDTDIYGPSIRRMLPEEEMPRQEGETIIPAIAKGIRTISMAYFRKEQEAAVIRAPIANGIINQFLNGIQWGSLDYLIVDFPPGTGDIQLSLSQRARFTGAILVTTPQEVAVMDVRKAAHMFQQLQVPILGIVENMSYYETHGEKVALFGEGGGKRLSQEIHAPLLQQIPIDPNIASCGDSGKSLESKSAAVFLKLAEDVVAACKKSASNTETIRLLNPKTLVIEWADGSRVEYQAADLQKQCPCAACQGHSKTSPDVEMRSLTPMGRYAVKIAFSSGCSNGIYTLERFHKVS